MIHLDLGSRPGKQIDNDVLIQALQAILNGDGVVATAENFGISRRTLTRWLDSIGVRGVGKGRRRWKRRDMLKSR